MRMILAAGAVALAASAADAAVIRYSFEADMGLDYALRFGTGYPTEGLDISDDYEPSMTMRVDLFEIDTAVFAGGSFSYDREFPFRDEFPAGFTALENPLPIFDEQVRVIFDDNLTLTDLFAQFDNGGTHGASFRIDSFSGSSSADYSQNSIFLLDPMDRYSYSADYVTIIATEIDAPAPVPLPASALLMLTGLAGFGAMRLRRR